MSSIQLVNTCFKGILRCIFFYIIDWPSILRPNLPILYYKTRSTYGKSDNFFLSKLRSKCLVRQT